MVQGQGNGQGQGQGRKVAVITPGSFVIPSGRSSSVERVIEKMVPLVADQIQIHILGRGEGHGETQILLGGVPCYRLPGGKAYEGAILRHLRIWRPEVVDVHNRPLIAYHLKLRLPFTTVFLTLHSTTFISSTYCPEHCTLRMLNQVDGIIVNSQFLKEELLRRFPGLQVPIHVNPLGVSMEDFIPRWTPQGEALRQARMLDLGIQDKKIILFVGRLIPSKGVHHIIYAFEEILARQPDAMLLIIGSALYGNDRESRYVKRLKKMANKHKERIMFLPFISYPKIADWYNVADVVVVPSSEEEAFGLVNVEAMATAVPVIATQSGGIPEIIQDGKSGRLLPLNTIPASFVPVITELLADQDKIKEMGKAGRERVRKNFRWQHTASRWLSLMNTSDYNKEKELIDQCRR